MESRAPLLPALAIILLAPATVGAQDFSGDVLQPDAFEGDPIGRGDTGDLGAIEPRSPGEEPAPNREEAGPEPPDLAVREGPVVRAIGPVHEASHALTVTLADGLARGEAELRFANEGSVPAEVRYRLAVPDGAELTAFAVCVAGRCRTGRPAGDDGRRAYDAAVRARGEGAGKPGARPIGHAERVDDGAGTAVVVHAAPVGADEALSVKVGWLVRAPLHGGTVRLRLPARGRDPRAAPAAVRVRAEGLLSPRVDGAPADDTPVAIEPWATAEVIAFAATAAAPRASVVRFRCGHRWCVHAFATAGPRRSAPRDLVVLLDASRSTHGPARGRMMPTLAALLAAAPEGSRVQAVAFASSALVVQGHPLDVTRARLRPFADALDRRLGGETRFEAAWPAVRRWAAASRAAGRAPLLVLLGDGGLMRSDEGRAAFADAAARNLPVNALDVGDAAPRPALAQAVARTGGRALWVGGEAERARRGDRSEPLEERLAALFAPVALPRVELRARGDGGVPLGPLLAGESIAYDGPVASAQVWLRARGLRVRARPAAPSLAPGLTALVDRANGSDGSDADARTFVAIDDADRGQPVAHACGDRGPAQRPSGISSDAAPVALAESRACPVSRKPPGTLETRVHSALDGKGVPAHTVLTMLRQRVVPVARRCLRRDRRGRTDYAVHATLVFRLAEREVVESRVEGDLPEPLRACLAVALDALDVPPFEGTVAVRYPIHTERAPEPPVVELEPAAADAVHEVTEGYPATP